MSPEIRTWSPLPSRVIDQTASLRAFDVTNSVSTTLAPVRSALDLGWSRSTRQVTIQTPRGPRRRPARFMTTSASPFTATALSDAHP
jgi:hypothetical protein